MNDVPSKNLSMDRLCTQGILQGKIFMFSKLIPIQNTPFSWVYCIKTILETSAKMRFIKT